MRRFTMIAGVVGVAIVITTALTAAVSASAIPIVDSPMSTIITPAQQTAATRVHKINAQLATLEPYVVRDSDGEQQLNTRVARRDGAARPLLELAEEIVTYQNRLKYGTALPDRARYPRLSAFFDDATTTAVSHLQQERWRRGHPTVRRTVDVAAVHPCGTTDNPVPAQNPQKVLTGPYSDTRAQLASEGYHLTAGYACGRSSEPTCVYDYTRGRTYTSGYGTCPAPAFRDQATLSGEHPGYYWFQAGEPNPELEEYDWPYWNWGSYVSWWHQTY